MVSLICLRLPGLSASLLGVCRGVNRPRRFDPLDLDDEEPLAAQLHYRARAAGCVGRHFRSTVSGDGRAGAFWDEGLPRGECSAVGLSTSSTWIPA